jgi:Zn-dependent protease
MERLSEFVLLTPSILFALTFHEFAHAWMANRLGDPTARDLGRLTLNPLAHLDFFGTLMIFLSGFRFGWAKPVPFNPYNLKEPKRGILLIALAGPVANMIIALVCGLIIRISSGAFDPHNTSSSGILFQMVVQSLLLNLSLGFFNLIPVPPLDGSKIMYGLLPDRYAYQFALWERVGPLVLVGIILLGSFGGFNILGFIFFPFVRLFAFLFAGIQF